MSKRFRLWWTDEYGIVEYSAAFRIIVAFAALYAWISLAAGALMLAESTTDAANIKNYADAFWTIQMAASTIGFGDFYPVTQAGRVITALSFYIGVGLAGYIGAVIAEKFTAFADTAVKNRELRHQNKMILNKLEQLERKLENREDRS